MNAVIRNTYRKLVGRLEEKRALRGAGNRQEHNIKIDFRVIVWKGVELDSAGSATDGGFMQHSKEPSCSIKGSEFLY
jgi:hypothetical protein